MQMKKDLDDIEKVSDAVIQLDVVGAHSDTHTHSPLMFFSRFTPA